MDNTFLIEKLRELGAELAVGTEAREAIAVKIGRLADEIEEIEKALLTELAND